MPSPILQDLWPNAPAPFAWRELVLAPLLPVALGVALGLVCDRYLSVPMWMVLACSIGSILLWTMRRVSGGSLLLGIVLGSIYHHSYCHVFAPQDLSQLVSSRPLLVHLRGMVTSRPISLPASVDPLRNRPREAATILRVRVDQLASPRGWQPVQGIITIWTSQLTQSIKVNQPIEVKGWLRAPRSATNPGELDPAQRSRDQRLSGELQVPDASSIVLAPVPRAFSITSLLDRLQGWGEQTLEHYLPQEQAGIARALLLGDTTAMRREEWQPYRHTGTIHILAISGQHLVVLGLFVAAGLRTFGFARGRVAIVVALVMLGYALLTGGRPAGMRAAIMGMVASGAILLRSPTSLPNSLALAWIIVILQQPTAAFTTGCQFSFVATILLVLCAQWGRWRPVDPRSSIIGWEHSGWQRKGIALLANARRAWLINALMVACLTPLIAYHTGLITPAALLIGPLAVLLSSIALISGFLCLMSSLLLPGLAEILASATATTLQVCHIIVTQVQDWPGAFFYIGWLPTWWVLGFYALLAVWTIWLRERLERSIFRLIIMAWLCLLGLFAWLVVDPDHELRVSFLAVGHGLCVVVESPDGRTLLYDAGTIHGPEVGRNIIAPYLRVRGIRRIDEIFVSHADLDHINGLPELMGRFPIGQITVAAGFSDKQSAAATLVRFRLEQAGIPIRQAHAGDRFQAGSLTLDVLHPPRRAVPGNANANSMVLLLRHADHEILLTGDVEGKGFARLRQLQLDGVDVLLLPHHGSPTASPEFWLRRLRPQLGIISRGHQRWLSAQPSPFERLGIRLLTTDEQGTITIYSQPGQLRVRTFLTRPTFQSR